MNTTLNSYAAGIIDGEGCVSLFYRHKENGRRYVTPSIQVSNTNKTLLDFLQNSFGGRVVPVKTSRPNRKPCWCWVVYAKTAMSILRAIYPFLLVKKPQADILMAIDGQRDERGKRIRKNLTPADFEANEKAVKAIRALNKRGI